MKSLSSFLEEVIIPIENNLVDTGKLYVFYKSIISHSQPVCISTPKEREWFPSERNEGEWTGDYSIRYLHTLSSMLIREEYDGFLFRAEFRGETKTMTQFVGRASNEQQKIEIDARKHYYDCIQLGVSDVQEARLISKVNTWNLYILWIYAIDCAERAFIESKKLEREPESIYRDGIEFARAASKYFCGIENGPMVEFLNFEGNDMELYSSAHQTMRKFEKNVIQAMQKDYITKYVGKSVLASINYTHLLNAATQARNQKAQNYYSLYGDLYDIPGMIPADNTDDKIAKRIWYAMMKQELDWQIAHLNLLLGQ